jgi:hypothetical protein
MKNYSVYLFFTILTGLLISGCGDNTVINPPVNTTINVNGRVSDILGTPISGISIIIGSQTVTSGADGNFTVNNVNKPYDCQMLELSSNQKYGYLYKGLSTASPRFTTISGLAGAQYSSNIAVTFPNGLIPVGKKVLLFYSDTTNVIFGKVDAGPVNNAVVYTVPWANNNSTIDGKICALIYSVDGSGNIVSYDNYAEAQLPVTSGGQSVWQPSSADFSLNPGEESLIATINAPGGYSIISSALCINFSKLTNNPFILAFSAALITYSSAANISALVPTGLPSGFTLNLFTRIAEPSGASGYKSFVVQPGVNNNVIIEPASVLNTPLNGTNGIDTTSIFDYSQGSGSGIYAIQFNGFNNTYVVYTSGLNCTMPNFSPNLNIEPNTGHTWRVTKYQGLNSVDEYVNAEILHMVNLPGVLSSANRTFTTAP